MQPTISRSGLTARIVLLGLAAVQVYYCVHYILMNDTGAALTRVGFAAMLALLALTDLETMWKLRKSDLSELAKRSDHVSHTLSFRFAVLLSYIAFFAGVYLQT